MPSAGLELPTFGTKGQIVTTRPLRHVEVESSNLRVNLELVFCLVILLLQQRFYYASFEYCGPVFYCLFRLAYYL